MTCHVTKHKIHDCKVISDIYKTFRQILSRDVEQVAAKESSFMHEVRRLELEKKKYEDGIESLQKELCSTANEIKRRIDEAVYQMMAKLTDKKTAASKITYARKSYLEFAMAASQSLTIYSCELLSSGKPSDVTKAFNELHERANELLKRGLKAGDCCLPEVEVTANDLNDVVSEIIMDMATSKLQKLLPIHYLTNAQ